MSGELDVSDLEVWMYLKGSKSCMAFSYPQDTEEFQKERRSYQTLFYKFDMTEWAPNGSDNTDHGMDYGFE